MQVERQVLHWFRPTDDPAAFGPKRCPVHLWQFDGQRFFYGIPDMGAGVKLAFHHGGAHLHAIVCLYTKTPDEHFWIDRCPGQPEVLLASPCSGHGFKFAPVVGELLADLVQDRTPGFDLSLFRWR